MRLLYLLVGCGAYFAFGSGRAEAHEAQSTCKPSLNRGLRAFNKHDFEQALCHWLPKARAGNPVAQNNMGVLFENGLSVQTPQSDERAAEWYVLAAKQYFVEAMINLARVQTRLGLVDAANTWLALAADLRQQRENALAIMLEGFAQGLSGGANRPLGVDGYPRSSNGLSYEPQKTDRTWLCPDGSYVTGTGCSLAPNGKYVGGTPTLAPDGSYVSGTPHLTPNGSYVGGTRTILCPDGSYVAGTR